MNKKINYINSENTDNIMFSTSVIGKVSNFELSYSKSIYPVFEAITNSCQSLEEVSLPDKKIRIILERLGQQKIDNIDIPTTQIQSINSVEIIDNGVGFNEINFNSFLTSDSILKKEKGGKGIGRFSFLKVFESVKIKSTYKENGVFFVREFDFTLDNESIKTHIKKQIKDDLNNVKNETSIKLIGLKKEYKESFPKLLKIIALKIIKHNLISFSEGNFPNCEVYDKDENKTINLHDLWEEEFEITREQDVFILDKNKFKVTSIRSKSIEEKEHIIALCANGKAVVQTKLNTYIPNLNSKLIKEENGKEKQFVVFSYITSSYLDKNVNSERTKFNIEKTFNNLEMQFEDITLQKIEEQASLLIKNHLKGYLDKIQEKKMDRIQKYINNEAIQYKALLRYKDDLEKISPNIDDFTLNLELHKIKSKIEQRLKKESKEFLSFSLNNKENFVQYQKKLKEWLEEENEIGKSNLAQYILHRKLILSLLEKSLEITNNKYQREDSIHELVFPLRKESTDINYESMNLWLIDEKLSYHNYLASEKKIKSHENIESDSENRTDITIIKEDIFDNPFAFSEQEDKANSVIIIEFKRPDRNAYPDDYKPAKQVLRYIKDFKEKKAKNTKGRIINITETTPFYCYILCDLTPNLINILENEDDFTIFPEKNGYYRFFKNLNAYIEVISYDRLISNAKQRNNILFDKLNISKN